MNTEEVFNAIFWTLLVLMFLMRFWFAFCVWRRASDFGLIALLINAWAFGRVSPTGYSFFCLPRSWCISGFAAAISTDLRFPRRIGCAGRAALWA
jgi:hypothetical protein